MSKRPGSTWVLLRGLARDSRHWEGFPARLAQALGPDARVLAPDLPGNGILTARRSPASVAGMVEAYRQGLKGERVHLLGLSQGAMVAIEWAHRYPHEIASMMLVNGSVGGLSPAWHRMRPRAAWVLAGTLWPGRPAAEREKRLVSVCSNLADRELAATRWARHAREASTSSWNAARQLMAAMRFRLPPSRPQVAAIVVASAADRLVSVDCSVALARRWQLPLLMHPTAGHEIALDDPGWLARQCAHWQAGLRGGLDNLRS
jgi:pimeloyl-ACP methyl ester carboxylesterase